MCLYVYDMFHTLLPCDSQGSMECIFVCMYVCVCMYVLSMYVCVCVCMYYVCM